MGEFFCWKMNRYRFGIVTSKMVRVQGVLSASWFVFHYHEEYSERTLAVEKQVWAIGFNLPAYQLAFLPPRHLLKPLMW